MFTRPHTTDPQYKAIWALKSKFNQALISALSIEKYMSLFSIDSLTENKYFDATGKLTVSGQYKFWCEIDDILKRYVTTSSTSHSRYVTATSTPMQDRNRRQSSSMNDNHHSRDRYNFPHTPFVHRRQLQSP